jgi:hypothetical protein
MYFGGEEEALKELERTDAAQAELRSELGSKNENNARMESAASAFKI